MSVLDEWGGVVTGLFEDLATEARRTPFRTRRIKESGRASDRSVQDWRGA